MNALAWLNPGRWLLVLALVAALTAGYFGWRGHQREIGRGEIRTEYAKQAKKADEKRGAVAAPIAAKQAAAQSKVRTVTKTLIEKVNVYVKATDCPLPAGFRSLHDAAAANVEIPDAAAIADDSAVPAQAVAETVIGNYGTCHETATRLSGLQDWVSAQGALK